VTPGSKAAKQGILIGDLLVSINNEPCDDMTHSNALNCVKKSGKDLILTLERYGPILFIKYLHPPPHHPFLIPFDDVF
jgi:C-terminal processing protease CtpA/Prc